MASELRKGHCPDPDGGSGRIIVSALYETRDVRRPHLFVFKIFSPALLLMSREGFGGFIGEAGPFFVKIQIVSEYQWERNPKS